MQNSSVLTTSAVTYGDSHVFQESVYTYNYTHFDEHDSPCITDLWSKRLDMVYLLLNSLTCLLGVIGNGLVIFLTGFRMKKTIKTFFFLNLAIADFTFASYLSLNIAYVALDFHWPFGSIMCKLKNSMTLLNLYSSVFFLMVISINRFKTARNPLWAQNYQTPRCALFVALGVWILSLVLSSPYIYYNEIVSGPHNVTRCITSYGHTQEQATHTIYAIFISRFILAFIIPFSVITACYRAMVSRLRGRQLAQSRKPFKVIVAVTVVFFVCWFPYHFFSFFILQHSGNCELLLVSFITNYLSCCLAYFNSCLNPIIYIFMGHGYRKWLGWSLLSAMENAFSDDNISRRTNAKDHFPTMQEESTDL
ncbi:chemerin-like receptor 1 [Hemicordylus capensis]|uniref:chemerin-like receptor 1 n=1 Tax=Hemicordylus capensis TaxID=884348 RepID=UPI002303C731|nr:chemerin-like receptor 1 [Hemicordylus capensis]